MKLQAGIFSIVVLIVIVITAQILVRVYWYRDFPIFTDEDQISTTEEDTFGWFSQFL